MGKEIQFVKVDLDDREVEHAVAYFCDGRYCSQAILLAFGEKYKLDDDTAIKISCGLNSGARCASICGAALGAVLVIGMKHGDSNDICNLEVEKFLKLFGDKMGGLNCRDILGCDIFTPEGRAQASEGGLFGTVCVEAVTCAAQILKDQGY